MRIRMYIAKTAVSRRLSLSRLRAPSTPRPCAYRPIRYRPKRNANMIYICAIMATQTLLWNHGHTAVNIEIYNCCATIRKMSSFSMSTSRIASISLLRTVASSTSKFKAGAEDDARRARHKTSQP